MLTFREKYFPLYDIIFTQIVWHNDGGLFYIPKEVQRNIFDKLGRDKYIKLPSQGTNPRGVEITSNALKEILEHEQTLKIKIKWKKSKIDFNPYVRWVEHWQKN